MQVQSKRIQVTDEIRQAVLRQLDSGVYYGGEQAYCFEREIAAYLGAEHVVVVNSGTSGLLVAAIALDINPGDEVLIPANSYVSCAEIIAFRGATPVFCDVHEETGNIDVTKLPSRITPRTKAVFVTHLYGHPVEMDALLQLAEQHKLRTVEMCAHALGAEYKGRKVGTLADIGVLSLGSKNISIASTGGAFITRSKELYDQACAIHRHGWLRERITPDFFRKVRFAESPVAGMFPVARDSIRPGLNLQLDEIPCAIGRVALRQVDKWNARRREVADHYTRRIQKAGLPVVVPSAKQHVVHAYLHYVIKSKRRNELLQHLQANEIEALIHYPVPIPEMQFYAQRFPTDPKLYPIAKRIAGEILTLPIHPWITDEEIDFVVETMRAFYKA
jgi:dTDP-4-amino-4,6-dideoxygalactose transaminase